MSRIDLQLIVEGETEELFVKRVLAPHLRALGLVVRPVLPGQGESRRGGRWPWTSVQRDVLFAMRTRSVRFCGIMFDYYALPTDWPGIEQSGRVPIGSRAEVVESQLAASLTAAAGGALDPTRFIPHIQLHEFEARLFSDCDLLAEALDVGTAAVKQAAREWEQPEAINDGPNTAPSKRIAALSRLYRKTTTGVSLSEKIGLPKMRERCPHFNAWVSRIEALPRAEEPAVP